MLEACCWALVSAVKRSIKKTQGLGRLFQLCDLCFTDKIEVFLLKYSPWFVSYLSGQAKPCFQNETKNCILGAKIACLGNDPWLSQLLEGRSFCQGCGTKVCQLTSVEKSDCGTNNFLWNLQLGVKLTFNCRFSSRNPCEFFSFHPTFLFFGPVPPSLHCVFQFLTQDL